LTLRAFEVESVEKRGNDYALDVKILPNRVPDASGHIGLAREIAALKNDELRIRNYELGTKEGRKLTSEKLVVKIEAADDCARYIARMIDHIKIRPSPAWLKSRLEVCGLQSINNIVDAANYAMLELGQPLHVFDYDKLKAKSQKLKAIIVRRAKKGEKIAALDGKTYDLNQEILVIADEAEPVAIAGIKGGTHSGVSELTKTIVLEAANFDPVRIRKGSLLLNIKTDASYRFEHGLDPNLAETAIDRLAGLIIKIAGGELLGGKMDVYSKKVMPRHLPLRVEYANRLAGVNFPPIMYEAALKRLGFAYQKRRAGEYHVETPTIRQDLEREEDLIEEVIRMWGYEKIPAVQPTAALAAAKENDERFWEKRIKDFLAGAGFTEVFRYIFTGESELKTFGLDWQKLIEVANPLTPDYKFLAGTPLPAFINTVKENESHNTEIRIFGLTKSFSKGKGNLVKGIDEKKRLIVVWSEKSESSDELFFRLKGALDELFESLGLAEHWYDDSISNQPAPYRTGGSGAGLSVTSYQFLHPYRAAEIKVDDEKIGVIGELHPAIQKVLKMKNSLAAAEIDAEKLIGLAEKEAEYLPISRFPAVIRDIAIIVPEEEKTETVTNIIENIGGKLLVDSDLFDYFQDEAMEKGRKKSLAFHLIFQSPERTLTDSEVQKIIDKIVKALEKKRWLVRK